MLKKIKFNVFILLSLMLLLTGSAFANSNLTVVNLTCNHFTNPGGILKNPLFGWQMISKLNNQSQTGYQIIVSSTKQKSTQGVGDVWDSKKVTSANSLNIPYQGKEFKSSKIYYWSVKVWDKNGKASAYSKPAYFITGLINKEDIKGTWVTSDNGKGQPMPLFRKSFTVDDIATNAIIHISGLGYYELYVNGKKVGDHVLDPGQTNYDDYAFYVTYDVSKFLHKGENTIGVMLGDGWYNQDVVWGGVFTYGKPTFWCQMDVFGKKFKQVVSDETWKWTNGPILKSNVYAGEVYDARKEVKNWSANLSSLNGWTNVLPAKNYPKVIVPQDLPPIKKMDELTVKRFYKTAKGTYIFDLGQNFAGWNKLKVNAPKGTEIKLTMGEEVFPDGSLNTITTGTYATKVKQTEIYITKGKGVEVWEPRFTYHGFRYIEVEGLINPPTKELLTGIVVHSAVPKVGDFSCSNPQINKLHKLSYWTLISNLHSIPTDCPHREKCGWLGDAHAMAPTTIYNFDMQNFWLKYMEDIHSTARIATNTIFHVSKNKIFRKGFKEAGIPFMVAPGKRLPGAASPDWGTAVVQLPWFLYKYYDNKHALEKFYPDMRQWVNYVGSLAQGSIIYEGLGDWCPPGGNENIDCPVALSSTAFHYRDLTIMKDVAGLLGKKQDSLIYADSASNIKKAFIQKFYDVKTNSYGSHTANSLALDFGLIPQDSGNLIANAIVKTSQEQFKGFMYVGIFGLQRIFDQLSSNGNEQAAYDILNKKGDYSFELMWKKYNATTLWEVLPVDTLQQKVEKTAGRSHNHPMQAGFDAWFFYGIAGINPDLSAPGFKKIILKPELTAQLDWAKGSYNSVHGKIVSDWKKVAGKFIWNVEIPVGSTAQIVLPKEFSKITIYDGGDKIWKQNLSAGNYDLGSGKYKIEAY
jgi:alpha-L-rhamnosidase